MYWELNYKSIIFAGIIISTFPLGENERMLKGKVERFLSQPCHVEGHFQFEPFIAK